MDPKGKGMVAMKRKRSSSSTSLETTSQPTQARVTKKETRIRRGASRRLSTTIVMPRLLHHTTTTMTPRQRRNRLIKTIPLIILASLIIQMPIYNLFHSENPHILMERTIHFGVIKCVVTYFPSILVSGKLLKWNAFR